LTFIKIISQIKWVLC